MKVELNLPDDWPPEELEQVAVIQEIIDDPDKNLVVIAVPSAWTADQFTAFNTLVRTLREEVSELV